MKMGGPGGMSMTFLINGETFELGRIDEIMKVGQPETWEIVNPTDMDHPFHIHGTQFQVIDTEKSGTRVAAPFKAWKDTVNVASKETVRIKIVQEMPGDRMYHCHILEHEHLGMMGTLRAGA
jgi:bilirubin oxidase